MSSCASMGLSISGPALVIRNYFQACSVPMGGDLSAAQIGENVSGVGIIPSTTGSWANFVQP